MAETFQTDAIVLRRNNLSEVDKFFVVYTAHVGKVSLMAKGIRKTQSKLAGHMEPGSLVRIMIARGKRSDKLAGAALNEYFIHLRSSFLGTTVLQAILEFVHMVTKEQYRDVELFHKIVDGLSFFDSWFEKNQPLAKDVEKHLEVFFFHLLYHLGYRPELEECVVCRERVKKEDVLTFDTERAGLAHTKHYSSSYPAISEISVCVLQSLPSRLVSEDFFMNDGEEWVSILRNFREHTTEGQIKSLKGMV